MRPGYLATKPERLSASPHGRPQQVGSKSGPRKALSREILATQDLLWPLPCVIRSVLLERGEFETIRVFGHRLKGTGGAYGLLKLTEIGTSIERAAAGKSAHQLPYLFEVLETYLSQLEVAAA